MIGTTFAGRYEIEQQIGIGGMGIVYRAHDTRLRRDVAIKVIAPHLMQMESARQRFLREAHALAGLTHPNIVTIFDMAEDPDSHTVFLVMELLSGHALRHFIPAASQNPDTTETEEVPSFSQIALPLCRALENAHNKGVLHRDIKPENIFICEDETLKLMDFGLARLLGDVSKNQSSVVAGTLAYMSPEQLRGEALDVRSDLYALGVVFYEYLLQELPFTGDNPGTVLLKHLTEPPPSLCDRWPELPAEIDRIVLRMLAKDPAERFASAAEVRTALMQKTPEGTSLLEQIDALLAKRHALGLSLAPANTETRPLTVTADAETLKTLLAPSQNTHSNGINLGATDSKDNQGRMTEAPTGDTRQIGQTTEKIAIVDAPVAPTPPGTSGTATPTPPTPIQRNPTAIMAMVAIIIAVIMGIINWQQNRSSLTHVYVDGQNRGNFRPNNSNFDPNFNPNFNRDGRPPFRDNGGPNGQPGTHPDDPSFRGNGDGNQHSPKQTEDMAKIQAQLESQKAELDQLRQLLSRRQNGAESNSNGTSEPSKSDSNSHSDQSIQSVQSNQSNSAGKSGTTPERLATPGTPTPSLDVNSGSTPAPKNGAPDQPAPPSRDLTSRRPPERMTPPASPNSARTTSQFEERVPAPKLNVRLWPRQVPDDTRSIHLNLQNSEECNAYFYIVEADKQRAVRAYPGPERFLVPQLMPNAIDFPFSKETGPENQRAVLMIAASTEITNLPVTLTLPPLPAPPNSTDGIQQQANTLKNAMRVFYDQIGVQLQQNHANLNGKPLRLHDVIVRMVPIGPRRRNNR